MSVQRIAGTFSTAIQQRIASGQHFDGTLPAVAGLTVANHCIYKYPSGNTGGLFFWENSEPIICGQVHVSLGASGDIHLYLVNLDPATIGGVNPVALAGEEILIEEAAGVTYIALDEARFKTVILPGQALKLVTTNSSAVQIAQAVASIERTYIR
jgi:hypothetical protein